MRSMQVNGVKISTFINSFNYQSEPLNKTLNNVNYENNNVNNNQNAVKVSTEAYTVPSQIKAASGKDTVEVTKVDNKFIIHFDNSAILNRIVQRGYLEVDCNTLKLSEETKQKLLSTNEKVEEANERNFMQALMKHEVSVARQQADAFKQMSDKQSRTLQTASRIMHGRKVSQADEQELMMTNPELYAMAKSAALMKKHHRNHINEDEKISRQNDEARFRESQPQNYTSSALDYQRFETQMIVSFDEAEPQIQSISASPTEFTMNGY